VLDWILEGGDVIDGSRAPRRRADVGIRGDRITAVGDLAGAVAGARLDVAGKTVVPGFIDAHSHSDLTVLANPGFESTVRQGVTTEVVGNCGLALAPLAPEDRSSVLAELRSYGYPGPVDWTTIADYRAAISAEGMSANLAWFVGHNRLRAAADRCSGEDEARTVMLRHLHDAMEAGAVGLSTGLEYEPGRRADTEELVPLAQVVAKHGGFYASHIRNRDAALLEAVDEFIDVVRRSGVRGQVSHLNVRSNTGAPTDGWERAVGMIEDARRDGFDVMADTTAFTFGIGLMANVLPPWLFEADAAHAAAQLGDRESRRRVIDDVDRYWRFLHRGEWHRARLLSSLQLPELNGLTFAEIAEQRGQAPWDAFLDILQAAGPQLQSVWMVGELFTEDHMVDMVRHPLFLLGADTMSARADGAMGSSFRNPISYGAHVHFLLRYGLQLGIMPVEDLVWKMTSMPAERFGLADRGTLRPGSMADVVVVDLGRLEERLSPPAYARGIDFVFVNGTLVIDRGEHTGARPGRHLSRQ
jgi:N-acyl-D-amino-acid deacylase